MDDEYENIYIYRMLPISIIFQWPKPRFQCHYRPIIQRQILQNGARWSYNGKPIVSHIRSIVRPWTTPNPHFKVTPMFDAEYISNGTRQKHLQWRTNRTPMRSIELCYFQWRWVTTDLDFKVTTLLNARCFENGARESYGRAIVSGIGGRSRNVMIHIM